MEICSLVFRKNLLSKRISYSWYMDKELRKSWDCAAKFRGIPYLFAAQSDYGMIAISLRPKLFLFRKYFIPLDFLFKQDSILIFFIGFHSNFQEFYELNFQRENRPKCAQKLRHLHWHTRSIIVPYIRLVRSTKVVYFSSSLIKVRVECVQA